MLLALQQGMLRNRAERLRATLLTSLGLLPLACGAQVEGTRGDGVDQPLSASADPPRLCDGPPRMVGDVNTGLVTCANGLVHRPVAVECPNRLPERAALDPARESCAVEGNCPEGTTCQTDADCSAKPYGHCVSQGQVVLVGCQYGCVTDADCGADEACVCGPSIGECVRATCRSAEDCQEGYSCAEFYDLFGVGCGEPMQLACHAPGDECQSPQECGASSSLSNCSAADGTYRCVNVPSVACGRPFLVAGTARLAPVTARRDYALPLTPCLDDLDRSARAQLSEAWLAIGRMEHASIAAFARFSLQLLELGAPHALLVSAQNAMADETEHTRLAFALASHYAGTALGPGSLPMHGALDASRLEDVLQLVLHEGCVGETVAALEAAECAAHAEDPVVRDVLERIARDEQAHAELAWRFVAWALGERPELASLVERELNDAAVVGRVGTSAAASEDHTLRRHGISNDIERAAIHAAAWRDVVRPCAQRLLARAEAA